MAVLGASGEGRGVGKSSAEGRRRCGVLQGWVSPFIGP
jgi:hypothetical protein